MRTFITDIGLIRLPANKGFVFGPTISPIHLNDAATNDEVIQGSNALARISGWGYTETEQTSMILQIGHIQFIGAPFQAIDPRDRIMKVVDPNLLRSATSHNVWPCKGDSGGKL